MSHSGRQRRAAAPVLAMVLTISALALRLYHLPVQSLSYDEAVSVYLARLPIADMLSWTAADVQPPLYYLTLKVWLPLVGSSEFAVRFPSVVAMTLAVALFYRLGRGMATVGRSAAQPDLGSAGQEEPSCQRSRWASQVGLYAALAATPHPWYVWHAQDARMYGLLLVLCLLASWLLLLWWRQQQGGAPNATQGGPNRTGVAIALPVTYAAAMYTHYLALPLFVYHLLLVAVAAWRGRRWQLLRRYLTRVCLPAALLYVPWLPAVTATYRHDASYYSGGLKLSEIGRDAFTALFVGGVGETVYERHGFLLALTLALALLLLLVVRRRQLCGTRLGIAAGALLVPGLCSLALLAVVPKFNPRYLLPASLALPLLWGNALPRTGRRASAAISVAGTTLLVVIPAAVLTQATTDPAFTRPDFRAAITAVRQGLQPGEKVILSSGHIYPVWQYYAPGLDYIPVPPLRVLSVDSVVRLQSVPALADELKGAPGAWVVRWQSEVTDPTNVLAYTLDSAGAAMTQRYWHVTVDHYRLERPVSADPLAQATPVGANFADLVTLRAVRALSAGHLALFWQAAQPLPDLRATIILHDPAGHQVAKQDTGLAGDLYSSSRWPTGETVLGYVALGPLPGVPAGVYDASLIVHGASSRQALPILDAAGHEAGQSYPLISLDLPSGVTGVSVQDALSAHSLRAITGEWKGLRLVGGGACPTAALPPGARFSLPLLWQVTGEHHEGALVAALVWQNGSATVLAADPLAVSSDTYGWRHGDTVLTWLDVAVPAAIAPDTASLTLRARDGAGDDAGAVTLCSLSLADVQRRYKVPTVQIPADAEIGDFARLLGADVDCAPCEPGTDVTVTVYWQALATPDDNYVAFVHLIGPDGRVWAQADREPLDGTRPTSGWLADEVIADKATLSLPADAPAGVFQLEVGFYDSSEASLPRVPAQQGGQRLPDDAVRLGAIAVQ